jgi:small subunit ribosomal protein S20
MRNRVYRSKTRTEVKKARAVLADGESIEDAIQQTRAAVSQLDKAVTKGVMHKNTASRSKSRLMKRLAQLEAEQAK